MSAPAKPLFRKLRGFRGKSVASLEELWLAEDHLLLCTRTYSVEKYRRFYFGDIEAYLIRPTSTSLVTNIVVGILAGLFSLAAAIGAWNVAGGDYLQPEVLVPGFLALMFIVVLVISLLIGKTCQVFLQTAAGTELLPTPRLMRKARKLYNLLAPLILAAQGVSAEPVSPASAAPASPGL